MMAVLLPCALMAAWRQIREVAGESAGMGWMGVGRLWMLCSNVDQLGGQDRFTSWQERYLDPCIGQLACDQW